MNAITSRIKKTGPVAWRSLKWLQGDLKEIGREQFERLKQSLRVNGFVMPFHVAEIEGEVWILDGHHRRKALESLVEEGVSVPDELPANFIECKSIQDAKKLVLIFSSLYAKISEEQQLYEFIEKGGLNWDELKGEIDLPQIDLKAFEEGWIKEAEFGPGSIDEQGRLDQKTPVKCPNCGHEFTT